MEPVPISQDRRALFSWWLCLGGQKDKNLGCCYLFLVALISFRAGKLLSKAGPWRLWAAGLELTHKMALNGEEEEMGVKSQVVPLVNQSA